MPEAASAKVLPAPEIEEETEDVTLNEFSQSWSMLGVKFKDPDLQKRYRRARVSALNVTLSSIMLFFCAPVWAIHCPRFWEDDVANSNIGNQLASLSFYLVYCGPLLMFLILAMMRERHMSDNELDGSNRGSDNGSGGVGGGERRSDGASINSSSNNMYFRQKLLSKLENGMKNMVPIGGALTCSSLMLARCFNNKPCTHHELRFLNTWSCNPYNSVPADTAFVCLIVPLFMFQMLKLEFRFAVFLWVICYGSVLASTIWLRDLNVSFWTSLCGASTLLLIVEGETSVALRFFARTKEVQLMKEVSASRQSAAIFRERQKLLRRVSHEMRSPLFVMTSALERINELCSIPGNLDEIKELCSYCNTSRALAVDNLDEVLLLDKIQSNTLVLNLVVVDLRDYLNPQIDFFRNAVIQNKSLAFTYDDSDLGAGNDVRVLLDTNRIRQVLMNFITNSIKFCPVGGKVRVTVAMTKNTDPADIIISVSDDGVGIAQEHLGRMFSEGYQIDPQRTQSGGGTGYGLFICKDIIAKHPGGEVWAESQGLNRGTTFSIKLPVYGVVAKSVNSAEQQLVVTALKDTLRKPEEFPPQVVVPTSTTTSPSSPSSPSPDLDTLSGLTILIVDDSDLVRKMLRNMLSRGLNLAEIVEAVDGLEAVEIIKQRSSDISGVIMDNQMPRMGGIEAIQLLRKLSFEGFVIGATGNAEHSDFHREGVEIVLKKPFLRDQLKAALCDAYVKRPTLAPEIRYAPDRPHSAQVAISVSD